MEEDASPAARNASEFGAPAPEPSSKELAASPHPPSPHPPVTNDAEEQHDDTDVADAEPSAAEEDGPPLVTPSPEGPTSEKRRLSDVAGDSESRKVMRRERYAMLR